MGWVVEFCLSFSGTVPEPDKAEAFEKSLLALSEV